MLASDISLGFELEYSEVDAIEDIEFLWSRFSPYGNIVEEGSLVCGFEFVSPIYSGTDFLSNSINDKIKNLFGVISRIRALEVSDCTGLHFHVGRNAFSEDGLQWLYDYCYSEGGQKLLSSIGGRSFNSFCLPQKPSWGAITLKEFSTRNTIINPNGFGGKTLEFRHCISTLKLNNFLAKAQLVVALTLAAEEISSGNATNFLDFLTKIEYDCVELTSLMQVVYEPVQTYRVSN